MQDNDVPEDVTVSEAPEVAPEPTLEALKAQLVANISNDAEVMRISKLIVKMKADVEKAETAKLQAEAEAMAGDRLKLSQRILKALKTADYLSDLEGVKATGFTYQLPCEANQFTVAVALLVPAIRKTGGGGGGGSTGALKQQTGLSRHEIIDQYATPEEKGKVNAAQDGASSRPDSARYMAEKPVIKRILADNPHLIKR